MIDRGGNVNMAVPAYGSLLHIAARRGDVEMINLLIEHGAGISIDRYDILGRTPIARAAEHRQTKAVEALLQAGADPNAGERATAAWYALLNEDIDTLRPLLEAGADMRGSNLHLHGMPPVAHAVKRADLLLLTAMIDNGARTDVFLADGRNLAEFLASQDFDTAKWKTLRGTVNGSDPLRADPNSATDLPAMFARLLVANGCPIGDAARIAEDNGRAALAETFRQLDVEFPDARPPMPDELEDGRVEDAPGDAI